MKSIIKSCLVFVFLLTISNKSLIQAADPEDAVRKVTLTNEFVANDSSNDYGVISSTKETFFDENGYEYTLTTEVIKEEYLPLDEILRQRGNGFWTSCFASPGTYTIVNKFHMNRLPYDALLVGNVVFNLNTSSVSIKDVNPGGTTSKVSAITSSATKVNSTFAKFNYKLVYPGNSTFNPQTAYVTMDTELAHGYSGSQLLYRYITNFYY